VSRFPKRSDVRGSNESVAGRGAKRRKYMYNIFYVIGLVVVVLAIFGYFRLG
jgi:hypothetical protein